MKKILFTGDKGYLGSEFVARYGDSYDVVGYDHKDGFDLLDDAMLEKKTTGCEQIVHAAAIPAPVEGKSFEEYFQHNVRATLNVAKAALANNAERIVYISSTTIYGIERSIPFSIPIKEDHPFVSQYITADQLGGREVDLSYHMSKVMAEQVMAWYGLNKKVETTALRMGPIDKVFLGTSVSIENATQAIAKALECEQELWYEPFSIVDDTVAHIDITKARRILGYEPETPQYSDEQVRSSVAERMK